MGLLYFSKQRRNETAWQRACRWLATTTAWFLIGSFLILWLMSVTAGTAGAEDNSFVYTEELYQEGLQLMEEAQRTCPSETSEEEEMDICTVLNLLVGTIDGRILEDITNEKKTFRLLVVREKARKLLSGDCCLIWRNIQSLPPPDQRWTKGF